MKRTLFRTISCTLTASAAATALVLLAACNEAPAPPPEAPAPILQGNQLRFAPNHPQLALLGIATAAPGKAISVELPARLVWNEERTQRIYPAFAGRVMSIKADVGQAVKPGTLLAQLASPDYGIAQADTVKAGADARLTQKSLQRQRELFEAGIIARKDLDVAEADAARSQAEIQRAEARTRLYGGGGGVNQQLALLATISGVVVERNLNPGQEVRPDQSGPGVPALYVITDPTSLWVQIDARESEIGTLKPGATFELIIPTLPGQKFEGRVTAAADYIDPSTRTIKVRGVVANPDRKLKAEMLATAKIERIIGLVFNTHIGAIPGALPPVIGWCAAAGTIRWDAAALFLILLFWQLPHFMAIAWMYRHDYARAGHRMIPAIDPTGTKTSRSMIAWCVVLMAASLMPLARGRMDWVYLFGALVLGAFFLRSTLRFRVDRTDAARPMFNEETGSLAALAHRLALS